jgi:hypothetical protein
VPSFRPSGVGGDELAASRLRLERDSKCARNRAAPRWAPRPAPGPAIPYQWPAARLSSMTTRHDLAAHTGIYEPVLRGSTSGKRRARLAGAVPPAAPALWVQRRRSQASFRDPPSSCTAPVRITTCHDRIGLRSEDLAWHSQRSGFSLEGEGHFARAFLASAPVLASTRRPTSARRSRPRVAA